MTEGAPETVVVVEGSEEPAEETGDETTNVTVVDSETGNSDAVVELATRVGALEAWRESMTERVDDVEQTAETAEMVAEIAEDTAIQTIQETPEVAADVAEEVAEETTEDIVEDEPPAKVHWTHRSMRDLFGGNR